MVSFLLRYLGCNVWDEPVRRRIAKVGFRSSFRDWAGEETDHPREVIEAALAHAVRNRVEAAYARSDLFERRRVLMDDWARYLARGIGCPREAQQRDFAPCRPG